MYYTEFIKVCNTKCQNMCDTKVKICRLCFSLHNEDDFVFITPLQTEMVQIVVPELDINISEYVVLCRDCTQNLETIFAFKSAFLEIEDNIHIFRQNDDQQVDLEKAIGIEQEDVLIKAKVCRTCLDFLENNAFIELNNDNAPLMEILKKCLPEMDIGLTKNPVLCRKCVTALENNCEFVGLCMENEKKIRLFVTNSNHCDKMWYNIPGHKKKTTDNIHTESVIKQENTTNLDNDFPTRNIKNNLNKNRDDILKEFVHSNVSVTSSKDKALDFLTDTSNIDAMYENDDDVVWEPVLNNIVTLRVGKKSDLSSNSTNVIIQTNENNKNNGNINPPSINSNISETHSGIINKDKAALVNSENTVSITLNSLGCTTNDVQLFDTNEKGSPDGGGTCKSLKNTAESETVSDSDSVYSVGSDNDSDSNNEDFSTADDNPREEITIVTESSSKQPKKNPGLNCKYCRTKIIGSIMRHNLICTGEPFRPKKRSKPSKSKKKAPKPPPPTTNQNPSQPPVTCFIFVANGNEQSSTINACQQAATAFINQQSTMTNTYKQWAMMNMNHGQGNFMLNQPLFMANRNPRFNNSLQQIVESPPLNQLPARENSALPFPATNLSQPYIIPNSNQQYMNTYNGRQPNRNRPLLPRTDYGPSNNLKPTNNPNTPSRKSVQLKYKGVKKPLATIIKQSVVKQPRAKQADPRHVIDPTPIEAPTATNLLEFPISSETETIEISDSEDTPEPRIVAKNRLMNLLLDKHKPTSLPPEEIQKTKKFVSKMLLPIDKIVKKLPGSSTRRNFIVISDIMVTGAKETNTTSNWSKECHSNTTKGLKPLETCTSGMTTADTSNDKLIETTTHSKYLTQSEVSCKEINFTSEQEQCEIPLKSC
ncbi:hypothetical protein NQ317_003364 [Molorchus minor]|uniref:ZAD domain-containing protein n=1 Tax=Molorchus minor TaxID=1323400 RepID=A0ABQ9K6M7_9CUCU|nr:hypothetical protein NQ317_003364 [Molorchus minor]